MSPIRSLVHSLGYQYFVGHIFRIRDVVDGMHPCDTTMLCQAVNHLQVLQSRQGFKNTLR